jgi:hypothetical protein
MSCVSECPEIELTAACGSPMSSTSIAASGMNATGTSNWR